MYSFPHVAERMIDQPPSLPHIRLLNRWQWKLSCLVYEASRETVLRGFYQLISPQKFDEFPTQNIRK